MDFLFVVYHMQRRMTFLLPMDISLAVSYEKEEFRCAETPLPHYFCHESLIGHSLCFYTPTSWNVTQVLMADNKKDRGAPEIRQDIYLVQFCTSRDHQPPTIICIPFAASVTYG